MENELSVKKCILFLGIYFIVYLFLYENWIALMILQNFGTAIYFIADLVTDLFMILLFLSVAGKWYLKQWQLFKKNLEDNLITSFKTVLWLYGFNFLFSFCIVLPLGLNQAENQVNNNAYLSMNPIGFLFTALVFAPMIEETIFRGCIYRPIAVHTKKNWLGMLCSGLCFGILHIVASIISGNWINCVYIILYGGCGILLCIPYHRTDSMVTSMAAHCMYNALGIILILI